MKKKLSVFSVLLALIALIASLSYGIPVSGQTDVTVRIGLFYNNSTACKAVQSTGIGSDSGTIIGNCANGQFIPLYEDASANTTIFRKDAYYTLNGSIWSEYQPGQGTQLPGGIPYGPWHVQLGGPFPDYQTAMQQVLVFRQAGIPAFPAYMDAWYIWTGYYIDQVSAQTDMDINLKVICPTAQFTVIPPSPARIVLVSPASETQMIFASGIGTLRIRPRLPSTGAPAVLRINGSRYRGDLEIRRLAASDMTVINILSAEEYLYGVVPCEIESTSHPESIKAQAVAARTYTFGNMGKHASLGFDLSNTTSDQVYKGFDMENPACNSAIDTTRGKYVVYSGKTASVFYFSSSGGMTEDCLNVWGTSLPYLKSVEDKYESGRSYNYNWTSVYTAAKVKETLISRGIDIGDIIAIQISKFTDAGRAVEVVIKGTKSQQAYTRWGCRTFLGNLSSQMYTIITDADVYIAAAASVIAPMPEETAGTTTADRVLLNDKMFINSTGICTLGASQMIGATTALNILGAGGVRRQIPAVPTAYTFTGKGWGHAVGMSQEGAKGMAAAGYTYDQILAYYFPGTQLQ